MTFCISATSTRTGILTSACLASSAWSAIGIHNAFRTTSFVRVAEIVVSTSTSSSTILFSANRISSTRGWLTRGQMFFNDWFNVLVALAEGVSSETRYALAIWCVAYNSTLGIGSTGSGAGITAFLVEACLMAGAIRVAHTLGPTIRRGSRVA